MEPANNYTPLVIDLENSKSLTTELNQRIDNVTQIWFTGYYLKSAPAPAPPAYPAPPNTPPPPLELLEIDMEASGLNMRNTVVSVAGNQNKANAIAGLNYVIAGSAKSIVICEPPLCDVRRDLNTWEPLLPKNKNINKIGRLRVNVRFLNSSLSALYLNQPATYDRLVLFFVCETADAGTGKLSRANTVGVRNQGNDIW